MKFNCPICGKAVQKHPSSGFFPFCCERCKLVDLNKWFDSKYVISTPVEKQQKDEPDEPENMLK